MGTKSGYDKFFKAARKAKKKTQRSHFPILPIGLFAVLLSFCSLALWNIEKVEHWISTISVSVFSEAGAETKEAKKAETPVENKEKKAVEEKKPEEESSFSKKGMNEEQINLFMKLDERKKQLDLREQELTKMDAELQRQKGELEKRLKDLEKVRGEISVKLQDRVQQDKEKVDMLVDVYSGMKPQNAAQILKRSMKI